MNDNNIDAKAIELVASKLATRSEGDDSQIVGRKSAWSPSLLRNLHEIDVRSDAGSMTVRIDGDTQEAIGWRYSDRPTRADSVQMTEEEAVAIAEAEIDVPPTAVLDSVDFVDRGTPGVRCSVMWKRVIDGIEVEGDFVYVKINPETREVISAIKNWSEI